MSVRGTSRLVGVFVVALAVVRASQQAGGRHAPVPLAGQPLTVTTSVGRDRRRRRLEGLVQQADTARTPPSGTRW